MAVVVRVTQTDGTYQQLCGRAAAMILWLAVYDEQVNHTHRGTLTFDWEGTSMRPQFHIKHDRINTDSLLPTSDESGK